jgi:lysine 2,3-aminomutase
MKQDRALRTARDLVAAGLLDAGRLGEAEAVAKQYAIAVTPHRGRADRPG